MQNGNIYMLSLTIFICRYLLQNWIIFIQIRLLNSGVDYSLYWAALAQYFHELAYFLIFLA